MVQKNKIYDVAGDLFAGCTCNICSLTTDEGSALELPRFIIRWEISGKKKTAAFLPLLPAVVSHSQRQVAPQHFPIWLLFK